MITNVEHASPVALNKNTKIQTAKWGDASYVVDKSTTYATQYK